MLNPIAARQFFFGTYTPTSSQSILVVTFPAKNVNSSLAAYLKLTQADYNFTLGWSRFLLTMEQGMVI